MKTNVNKGKVSLAVSLLISTFVWSIGLTAFTSSVMAATTGDLITKAGSASVYYLGADGKRYVFSNQSVFDSWYGGFSTVKTVTNTELLSFELGGNVVARAGRLIQVVTNDTPWQVASSSVYAVSTNGTLHAVDSGATAASLFGSDWETRIVAVPESLFTNYKVGAALTSSSKIPDGFLAKASGSTDTFLIEGGMKRAVSADGFTANMFKSKDVITTVLTSYSDGSALSGSESVYTNAAGGASTTGNVGVSGLTVAVASSTPISTNVPAGVFNQGVLDFNVTAGADGAVTISKIVVTRGGLSTNSDVSLVKLFDGTIQKGSSASLGSNNQATFNLSTPITVAAGTTKTLSIKTDLASGATAGHLITFSVASATDIVASGAVSGTFPVSGNAQSVTSLTIGALTIEAGVDNPSADAQVEVGDADKRILQMKLTANSAEDVEVTQIIAVENGTASATDVINVELYNDSDAMTISTVKNFDADGRATFDLATPLLIKKGSSKSLSVRVDIASGSSRTVSAKVKDGGTYTVMGKGKTYGYGVGFASSSWAGTATAQTIKAGALVASLSSKTPATGSIAPGASDVKLASFNLEAQGEAVTVTQVIATATLGTMVYGELTNCKILKGTTVVAGPSDTASDSTITWTDTFTVALGTATYDVTCNISSAVSASDSVAITIANPATKITSKGSDSNDSITASPASTLTANTMTVRGAALASTTLSSPAARSIVAGAQDLIFAEVSFNAGNSGEDVRITAVTLEDTLGDAADNAGNIDNVEIWADLTSATSARGDIYETKISSGDNFTDTGATDETLSVTLDTFITVAKDSYIKVAVLADIVTGATAGDTHTMSLDTDASDVTAVGTTTTTAVTTAPTGSGQTFTVAASGTLTTSVDSSSPNKKLAVGGALQEEVGVFRLAANNVENLDVDSILITDAGAGDTISTYYFYNGTTLLGTKPGGATAELFLTDGTLVIKADKYVKITVKADIASVDGSTVTNNSALQVGISAAGDVDTTGIDSGVAVDSTGTGYNAVAHDVYESVPTFTFATDTPSGALVGTGSVLVAKVKISANAGEDITFEAGDSNAITFSSATTRNDDSTVDVSMIVKDDAGTTLDTTATADAASTTWVSDFTTTSLTIPAGSSKTLSVYLDVTDLEDNGDAVRIWLDDSTATFINWGISGSGSYADADTIFRGDIYGGTLTRNLN
jgi:hypothetical protein